MRAAIVLFVAALALAAPWLGVGWLGWDQDATFLANGALPSGDAVLHTVVALCARFAERVVAPALGLAAVARAALELVDRWGARRSALSSRP